MSAEKRQLNRIHSELWDHQVLPQFDVTQKTTIMSL